MLFMLLASPLARAGSQASTEFTVKIRFGYKSGLQHHLGYRQVSLFQ
jgi:hypothetical protein